MKHECTDESFHENVASWIQQVVTKSVRPVVWIIGTHIDKRSIEEANKKKQHIYSKTKDICMAFEKNTVKELHNLKKIEEKQEYNLRSPDCVHKSVEGLTELKDSNVPSFVKNNLKVMHLTNTHMFTGFNALRSNIKSLLQVESFRQLAEPLSVQQHKAADRLRQRAEEMLVHKRAPILNEREVFYILNSELNSAEANSFLEYLCQVGELLICRMKSDPRKIFAVILDVDWLINLLKHIFHHDFRAMVREKRKTCTTDFSGLGDEVIQLAVESQQNTGIVDHQLLEALWSFHWDAMDELIELLENIELAYKTTKPSGCLFPWLVTQNCHNPIPLIASDQNERIVVSYNFSLFLPVCFIQELAVRIKKHTEVSIEAVYKNGIFLRTTVNLRKLSVHIVTLTETNSMCGKVHILTCALEKSSSAFECLGELWLATITVIRLMEVQLSSWRFYSSLKRKVYCPYCCSFPWPLEIKDSVQSKTPSLLQAAFNCRKCSKTVSRNYIVPPSELLLKTEDYVDISELPHLLDKLALSPQDVTIPASQVSFEHQLSARTQFRSQNAQYYNAQQFYSHTGTPNIGTVTPPPYLYSPPSYGHSPPPNVLGSAASQQTVICQIPSSMYYQQLTSTGFSTQPIVPVGTPSAAAHSPPSIQAKAAARSPPVSQSPVAAYPPPGMQPPADGTQPSLATGLPLATAGSPGMQQTRLPSLPGMLPPGLPLVTASFPPNTQASAAACYPPPRQPVVPTRPPQTGFFVGHNVQPGDFSRPPPSVFHTPRRINTKQQFYFQQQQFPNSSDHRAPLPSLPTVHHQPLQPRTLFPSIPHRQIGHSQSVPLGQISSPQQAQSWLHSSYPPLSQQPALSDVPMHSPNVLQQTDSISTVASETYSSSEQLSQELFPHNYDMEMDAEDSVEKGNFPITFGGSNPVAKSQGLTEHLMEDDIRLLARHTTATQEDWKTLLKYLGLSRKPNIEKRIFAFANDAREQPPLATELMYQVLLEWINCQGSEATVAVLATAILRAGMESSWTDAFDKLRGKLKK